LLPSPRISILFPIITDPVFYLVAIPAVVLLGLSKGGFAGLGTASTPLVALYLPPFEAAALILPVLICQDVISLYVYRRDWDPWNVKVILIGAAFGMALAWMLALYISDAWVRIIVGVICLVFVINAWRRRRETEPVKKTAASGVFWGTVTGFTSFMMQGGGPPYQVHVLPQRLPKMTLAGTTTVTFAVINSSKILPYMTLVDYTPRVLATSVALLPLAVVSNLLGVWLLKRVPTEAFYKIIYLLLFAVSLAMLIQGGAQIIGSFRQA
jgi:uncharacterized membrane protein YfcA